jgi:hypothetical protein
LRIGNSQLASQAKSIAKSTPSQRANESTCRR